VDPQGEAEVSRKRDGDDEPLFCGWCPEKVYGMEDRKFTETG